jgi:RHS repeat-associated protein
MKPKKLKHEPQRGPIRDGLKTTLFVGSHQSTSITVSGVARSSTVRTIDALGRINRIDTLTGATLHARRDYTYNTANQRTEVVHEDAFRWLYDYDALGQVTSAQKKTAASTLLPGYDHAYAYDTIGNRVNITTNGRLATYAPDLRNQYASRTLPGALDVLGSAPADVNILVDGAPATRSGELFHRAVPVTNASAPVFKSISIQATLPGPPAQTATETRSAFLAKTPEVYAHDLDGNLTQDGLWTYTWDAENRLIQLETRSDVAAQAAGLARVKLTFAYDSQGRRVRKQVFAWTGGAWAATPTTDLRFLYDGWNLLAEYNALSSNALVRTHVWGLDLSGREQGAGGVGGLLWTTSGATAHAPAYDANGNIVAWVDLATATVTGRRDYAAFGEAVLTTGNAASLPFAFSTKYRDNETELYYYGFRYYNPSTGRWLSRDPIGEEGGLNLYGMVGNNPINHWDYLGLNDYKAHRCMELKQKYEKYYNSTTLSLFDTADEAAVAAYVNYLTNSIEMNKEVGFAIGTKAIASSGKPEAYGLYQDEEQYVYSYGPAVVGSQSSITGLQFRASVDGSKVAYGHTHGAYSPEGTPDAKKTGDDHFSEADMEFSYKRTGLPFYLGTPGYEIKKYDPFTPPSGKAERKLWELNIQQRGFPYMPNGQVINLISKEDLKDLLDCIKCYGK